MRHLLILLVLLCSGLTAQAQDRATLIADSLAIRGNDVLVAAGNVEVFYQGTTLQATGVTYDRTADLLSISGPIHIRDANGDVVLADQAELSGDLTSGILISARLVLDQQLQLAANELIRVGGRYTALNRVAASSCKVCAGNPTPLWEIRARRVVHDQLEKQLYFDHAQFRVAGVPVFYLPRLRMPDPTLTRATGFLLPSLRSTSGLGFGVKVPYFIRIGDHRDLLLTPYVTAYNGRSLELQYRQAFRTGNIAVTTAASRDRLGSDEVRGYLTTTGRFDLPRDFVLSFDGIVVSDAGYLVDYGISDQDRLASEIAITRTRRDEYYIAALTGFQTLRDAETNAFQPSLVADLTFYRRFTPALLGGTAGFRFQGHGHHRQSTSGTDSDGDGIADGRDLGRLSVRADWRRNWTGPAGLQFAALADMRGDLYGVAEDDIYSGTSLRTSGTAAVELRWPWVKTGSRGVTQVIEPVIQLVTARTSGATVPNEDSALVEFDEGNLFALNRFPGSDAVEDGPRGNVGISYLRTDPSGWTLGVTAGRVFRSDAEAQFSNASGLRGITSDWLLATQLQTAGVGLINRVLLDDDLSVAKGEVRLDFNRNKYAVAASYVYVIPDPAENRLEATQELVVDAGYDVTAAWSANLSTRYDLVADRATRAGLGVSFRNECITLDLSLSRRYTSSTSVQATTDFGLSVEFLGIGGNSAGLARQCRR
jgi:LPS-assembly protein